MILKESVDDSHEQGVPEKTLRQLFSHYTPKNYPIWEISSSNHMPIVSFFCWYQNYFSETSGLFRILMFLEKVGFPFSQDLATFKIPKTFFQITLGATFWTDFRFVSCYNIQIGLSFNLAPIFPPSDLYLGIISTLKQYFLLFFIC